MCLFLCRNNWVRIYWLCVYKTLEAVRFTNEDNLIWSFACRNNNIYIVNSLPTFIKTNFHSVFCLFINSTFYQRPFIFIHSDKVSSSTSFRFCQCSCVSSVEFIIKVMVPTAAFVFSELQTTKYQLSVTYWTTIRYSVVITWCAVNDRRVWTVTCLIKVFF